MDLKLQKLRSLTCLEWRLIVSSLIMLPVCAVRLRVQGFGKTRAAFIEKSFPASSLSAAEQMQVARKAARAVDIAARFGPYRANCLKRSLVLTRCLHRMGIENQLRLGADLVENELAAHAWVEHVGVVINDYKRVTKQFSPLLPGSNR